MFGPNSFMRLEIPSRSENEAFARVVVAAFASRLDPTLEEISDLKTAVSEAVTNVVVHAYPDTEGPVAITTKLMGQQVLVEVKDNGCGIEDVDSVRRFGTTTCSQERMGIGLSLIESCMDHIDVQSQVGQGTRIVMSKRLEQQRGGFGND